MVGVMSRRATASLDNPNQKQPWASVSPRKTLKKVNCFLSSFPEISLILTLRENQPKSSLLLLHRNCTFSHRAFYSNCPKRRNQMGDSKVQENVQVPRRVAGGGRRHGNGSCLLKAGLVPCQHLLNYKQSTGYCLTLKGLQLRAQPICPPGCG